MKHAKTVADILALRILDNLTNSGIIPAKPKDFSWDSFYNLREKARKTFLIPETSITPLMARILFGIATFVKPSRILGIGTYAGNSLLWLVGPFVQSEKYFLDYAYGIDIDAEATRLAKKNFSSLGENSRIRFISADGHAICQRLKNKFDLVFMDADDSRLRKKVYLSILRNIYTNIHSGGLLLAHDICVPKFKEDLRYFLNEVNNTKLFIKTQSLEIDYCGLEVSKKV